MVIAVRLCTSTRRLRHLGQGHADQLGRPNSRPKETSPTRIRCDAAIASASREMKSKYLQDNGGCSKSVTEASAG
jgi:hypothetical protein